MSCFQDEATYRKCQSKPCNHVAKESRSGASDRGVWLNGARDDHAMQSMEPFHAQERGRRNIEKGVLRMPNEADSL